MSLSTSIENTTTVKNITQRTTAERTTATPKKQYFVKNKRPLIFVYIVKIAVGVLVK